MRYPKKINEHGTAIENLAEKDLLLFREIKGLELSPNLAINLKIINALFKNCHDVIIREFKIGLEQIDAAVIMVDGLASKEQIDEHLLRSLMLDIPLLEVEGARELKEYPLMDKIKDIALTTSEIQEEKDWETIITQILTGDALFIVNKCERGLIIGAKGWDKRGISEPATETVVRGPRDGFTETFRVNTALIRRRIRTPDLKMEVKRIGRRSKTDTCIVYIENLVNKDVLEEVKARLDKISIDGIYESGNIEELIEDNLYSPFPQLQSTERPDKVMNALLDGRVALIVDGTPFVIVVPTTFFQFFQSPEDYYQRWIFGSITRFLRVGASYLSILTPALYIAFVSFHPGLMPAQLMLAIAATRQGVPFPPLVEALIMEISFELIREAGARLPRAIGSTVGIVGGLIIGQAAVSAKLASPIMLIVVAITAIASFTIPSYDVANSLRLVRFPLMIIAAYLGLYGVMLGFIVMSIHMSSIKTFGVDYYAPFVPYQVRDWKDLFVRLPIQNMIHRPVITHPQDEVRQRPIIDGDEE